MIENLLELNITVIQNVWFHFVLRWMNSLLFIYRWKIWPSLSDKISESELKALLTKYIDSDTNGSNSNIQMENMINLRLKPEMTNFYDLNWVKREMKYHSLCLSVFLCIIVIFMLTCLK